MGQSNTSIESTLREALGNWSTSEELSELLASCSRRTLEQIEAIAGIQNDQYKEFQDEYRYDFRGFLERCIDWEKVGRKPYFYQLEAAERFVNKTDRQRISRFTMKGPRGLGKTAWGSWSEHWFALTRDGVPGLDWKSGMTASVYRQIYRYMWPEIHKWSRLIKWDMIGRDEYTAKELLVQNLKLMTGEIAGVASNDPGNMEGMHANSVFFLFDESKLLKPAVFDSIEGVFSNAGMGNENEAYAIAISTPGESQGRFYDIHARRPGYEDWEVMSVSLKDTILAGAVTVDWAKQRKKQWGEKSAAYQNHVLGEFSDSNADVVIIPISWVELAMSRWDEWVESGKPLPAQMDSVGVDIGLTGDRTVLAPRYGDIITELRLYPKADNPMPVVGYTLGLLEHGGQAIVDSIGIGSGVVGRLRELGKDVFGFNAGEGTDRVDNSGELGFLNKRSAAWWGLRELLDPSSGSKIALPRDDGLLNELSSVRWKVTSAGKIMAEVKADVKQRIGVSTDKADSVIQAFWNPEKQDEQEFFFAMKKMD